MDEFALIEKFFANQGVDRADVRLGIGDDAAVTTLHGDYELVIATDSICAGTHFPAGTPPEALGHRCLAVNLSDLAAMGAEPLWCTLVLSLPSAEADWLAAFANGFFDLARRFDVALIGGDTVRGALAMTVTVHGRVRPGKYVGRTGAGSGQGIYVTGDTGEAGAGLRLLTNSAPDVASSGEHLTRRFLYPEPRVNEARLFGELATAMIDISDGLHVDLLKMLDASQVGGDLDTRSVRLSHELQACCGADEALELALTGGDDYELCFTVPQEKESRLAELCERIECPVTRIGETSKEPGARWKNQHGPYHVKTSSFRHFS
jgi:thiamine-monophosphate kinase